FVLSACVSRIGAYCCPSLKRLLSLLQACRAGPCTPATGVFPSCLADLATSYLSTYHKLKTSFSFCTDSSRTSNRVLDDRSQTYTRRHLVALGPPWENDLYVLGDHAFDPARQPSVLSSMLVLHC